jgi:hypothetical protein
MSFAVEITGWIHDLRASHAVEDPKKVRVTVGYHHLNITNDIELAVPIEDARQFYIGQRLRIVIETEVPA